MKFYRLLPEVAGEIGEKSVIEYKDGMIKNVTYLHYVFHGWLGDQLITQTPCYLVTDDFANTLIKRSFSGCEFEQMITTKSDEFNELYPNLAIPKFVRLNPSGVVGVVNNKIVKWSGHDICLEDKLDLVITERALNTFQQYNKVCEFEELKG